MAEGLNSIVDEYDMGSHEREKRMDSPWYSQRPTYRTTSGTLGGSRKAPTGEKGTRGTRDGEGERHEGKKQTFGVMMKMRGVRSQVGGR